MDKVIIIAEAGVNHNGDINLAKRLIDVAADAGVDYVKFQTFKAERLVSREAKKAIYQVKNISDGDNSQYNMLKKLELSYDDHTQLLNYCTSKGINFFSTAFDLEGLKYLNELNLPLFKIPSGEVTNYPYLKMVATFGKPVILSTGMCTERDVEKAMDVLMDNGLLRENISVLHCNTEYPTPMQDVNLKAMVTLRDKFGVQVGYSDHTLGIEVPIAAVAMGAKIIEKHFTLDRNLPGPDHIASLEPSELLMMVHAIRNIELAISGDGSKKVGESEQKNISIARKSIHLSKDLQEGHIITNEDLIALRPGDGISPMRWNEIIGRKLAVSKKELDKLHPSDII